MCFKRSIYLASIIWLMYFQVGYFQGSLTMNKLLNPLLGSYKAPNESLQDSLILNLTWKQNHPIPTFEILHSKSAETLFTMSLGSPYGLNSSTNEFKNFSQTCSFNLPGNFYQLDEIEIKQAMKIYSVDLEKYQSLVVLFYDFNETHSFDVVIREHNVPNIRHFSQNVTINHKVKNQITYKNKMGYTVRVHMAVLPSRKMFQQIPPIEDIVQNSRQFNVSMIFMVASCVSWNENSSVWEPVCNKTGQHTPAELLNCHCDGDFRTPKVFFLNPIQIYKPIDRNTRHLSDSNGILSIFLIVTLLLYSIALVFGLGQRKNEIFYLSDNLWCDRYAYLIQVKTGFARSAGTTSNISIRLKGINGKSRPHVLNFPDPDSALLQRQSDDYFVLTTEKHLGEIQSLFLWHDSVGFSPTWECDHITVFDLQNLDRYLFRIKKNFRVTQKSSNYCIAKVTDIRSGSNVKSYSEHFTVDLSGLRLSWYKNATLAVSSMLLTFMVEMLISAYPTYHPPDIFTRFSRRGFENKYLLAVVIGAIVSVLTHLSFAYLFRNSAGQFHDRKVVITQYSFKVTVLTWSLLAFCIVISVSYMVFVDMWIPKVSHMFWFSSVVVSFFLQAALYFKAYVMLRPCFTACSKRATQEMSISLIVDQIESQRDFIYTRFGGMGLRPYLTHLYAPIPEKNISAKKLHDEILVQIIELIEDAIMVTVYLVILHYILFIDRDELLTYANTYFRKLITASVDPMSNKDFYDYFNHTLIKVFFPTEWYQDNKHIRGNIIDNLNTRVTVPRLRQVRLTKDTCKPYEAMKYLNTTCNAEFNMDFEDTASYLAEWKDTSIHASTTTLWRHMPPILTGEYPYPGLLTSYPGGGYVIDFFTDRKSVEDQIQYIEWKNWLSLRTRLLILTQLLYNVHANCFFMLVVNVEKSATGYFVTKIETVSSQWLFVNYEMEAAFMQIFAISVLWVALLTFKKMSGLMKSVALFFKDIWNAIDLTLILTSLICVTLMLLRLKMLEEYVEKIVTAKFQSFIPSIHLTRLELILLIISAAVIICAAIRLWKLLRFGRVFRIMETTIIMAATPLFCGLLFHIVITLAFGILGLSLFGPYSTTFEGTLGNTITTLLLLSVNLAGNFDYKALRVVPYGLGYLYLTFFLISMLTLYNIYKTIVIMSYSKAKQYFSNELAYEYTTKDYIKDNFNKLFKKKSRLKGGGTIKDKVFPKADEFRFANGYFVATHQMMTVQHLVLSFLRNKLRHDGESILYGHYDNILIERTVDHFFGKKIVWDTKELFYKGQMVGQHVAFVDEARIIQIENVVNIMLLTEEEKVVLNDKELFYQKKAEQSIKHLNYMLASLTDILKIFNNIEIGMPKL